MEFPAALMKYTYIDWKIGTYVIWGQLVICFYLDRFGSILQFQQNVIKVGSKSWLLTCNSIITLSLLSYTGSALKRELNVCNGYLRFVSSMPFRFPFKLPFQFYNKLFSQANMLKSYWPIHFQIISPTFQIFLIRSVT